MKLWKYKELRQKILVDMDEEDQIQIKPSELIGYVNEGIEDVEGEILKIDEDYMLTYAPMPLVTGVDTYFYPYNIYAYKIRGMQYANGSIIYPVPRIKRKDKFEKIAFAQRFEQSAQTYEYYTRNDQDGVGKMILIPAARETAVVPPLPNPFTPMLLWFIREANRVPLFGEYIPQYEQFISSAVSVAGNYISLTKTYVTGDAVEFSTTGVLPSPLNATTTYYIYVAAAGQYKLATTKALANAGAPDVNLADVGTGIQAVSIAANQNLIDNTIIDIPQFATYVIQYAKCRIYEKEGDPRLDNAVKMCENLRNRVTQFLTHKEEDDETTIEADLSAYEGSS
jgi:hypothetical protein